MNISFIQGTGITSATTTVTITGQNLGAVAPDRHVIVCIHSRKGGSTPTALVGVTIAGVAATEVVQRVNTTTNSSLVAIYIVAMPTGTLGDIVMTFSNAQARTLTSIYRAVDINPVATFTDTSILATSTTIATVLSNGAIFAAGSTATNAVPTYTGVTSAHDASLAGTGRATSGFANKLGQEAGRTVTLAFGGAATDPVACFAAFQPAAKNLFFSQLS